MLLWALGPSELYWASSENSELQGKGREEAGGRLSEGWRVGMWVGAGGSICAGSQPWSQASQDNPWLFRYLPLLQVAHIQVNPLGLLRCYLGWGKKFLLAMRCHASLPSQCKLGLCRKCTRAKLGMSTLKLIPLQSINLTPRYLWIGLQPQILL